MNLLDIMKLFSIRDMCYDCFTVDLIGSDVISFICIKYKGKWIIVNKNTEHIDYYCSSRCDCLECLNYFHGLPF